MDQPGPRDPVGQAYTLDVQHLRRSARAIKWEVPHLRDQDDKRGATKQEAFCWILFGSSNATTVIHFARGEPASALVLALFTYWSLYSASAEYSTRFTADGLDHRIFYMLLAISIFGMDLNWTGDVLGNGNRDARVLHLTFLATCYMLIGIMYARVAIWLPVCRKYALYHLLLSATSMGLYLIAARGSEQLCQVLCWLGCGLFLLRTYGLPMVPHVDNITRQRNAQDYISRAQSVMITTLALVVKVVAKGVQPGHLTSANWHLLLLSVVLVLLVKMLMFDVHIAETSWHAVRCSSNVRPTFFLSLVPVAMAGVMMMAAGCFLVLDLELQGYDQKKAWIISHKAGRHFSYGFGLMLLASTVMRILHDPPAMPAVPNTHRILMMWRVQVLVQLLLAAFSLLSARRTSGPAGLYRCVALTAMLVVLNLLDEMEELGHYRGNWRVVRTVRNLSRITSLMKKEEATQTAASSMHLGGSMALPIF
ncbi:unnamed protein product [Effrenium voratum]|nr:unnamed protein product [Effrenium voratum]